MEPAQAVLVADLEQGHCLCQCQHGLLYPIDMVKHQPHGVSRVIMQVNCGGIACSKGIILFCSMTAAALTGIWLKRTWSGQKRVHAVLLVSELYLNSSKVQAASQSAFVWRMNADVLGSQNACCTAQLDHGSCYALESKSWHEAVLQSHTYGSAQLQ